jgi:ribosomal protein S18 acetylase RimI-like enzyme
VDPAKTEPACHSAVAALQDDPFYRAISEEFADNSAERRSALARYFAYSIHEGRTLGRTVHLADPSRGVAVWLLPQSDEIQARAAAQKRLFLERNLGSRGACNYYRIVGYMSDKSQALVSDHAWYLSIIAVDPVLQGRGYGRELLLPTLMEADANHVISYLETFSARNARFYERLGFSTLARFDEPTTGAEYAIMVRDPRTS